MFPYHGFINNLSTSDPPVITTLTLNCQSLLPKRESFMNLINTYHPDIICGTESWLNSNIFSSEVFSSGYNVYRKDCADGYGGVFVACHQSLISRAVDISDNNSKPSVVKLIS